MIPEEKPFPGRVSIENTNACKAHRPMCLYNKLTSKLQLMDTETFKGLLKDSIGA